jgi:hypothetical protein
MPLTTGILSTSTDISRRTERSRGSRITAGLRAFAGRRSARLRWVCVEEGRFPAISLALLARRFGRDIALRSSAALSAVELPGVVWPFRNVQRARARGDDRRTTRLADLAPTADRYRPNSVPGEPDGASNRSGLAAAIRDDRYRESRGTRAGSTSRAISRGICGVRATAAGGEQSDAKGHGEYRCFAAHADWTHRHNRRFSPRAVTPMEAQQDLVEPRRTPDRVCANGTYRRSREGSAGWIRAVRYPRIRLMLRMGCSFLLLQGKGLTR